jgi:hypothetical protein
MIRKVRGATVISGEGTHVCKNCKAFKKKLVMDSATSKETGENVKVGVNNSQ